METKIYVIFGKSGTGKDTIADWLTKEYESFHKVTLDTTRAKRDCESQGHPYNFIDKNQFIENLHNRKYIAHSIYLNDLYYGIPYEEIKEYKKNIVVADLKMIEILKRFYSNDERFVFINIEARPAERLKRMIQREEKPNYYMICKRFCDDEEEYLIKKKLPEKYITFINNSDKDSFYGLIRLLNNVHIMSK